MEILYLLVPVALFLGLIGLGLMIWALKTGQFEDLEGPAHRILFDDDDDMMPHAKTSDSDDHASDEGTGEGSSDSSGDSSSSD